MIKKTFALCFFALTLLPVASFGQDDDKYFVFSFRPEFVSDLSYADGGSTLELGGISKKGIYFTYDVCGGLKYIGGGVNLGGCINKDGNVKIVFGASAGTWLYDYNKDYKQYNNRSLGGVLWKIFFGETNNFDITHKLLMGTKDAANKSSDIGYVFGFNYSLSIGYTLTKKR
ncbi:MAG: hypothetical protein FWF51_02870 [Chitinivibrionia bacterium]|nr:hypothetical protein [Chitinivibrionia bacterium]